MNEFISQTIKEISKESKPRVKKKDTVRQGETSEMIFAYKALTEHNLVVSYPMVTTDYDLVIENSVGVLKKIQVKSSTKGDGNVNICKGTGYRSGGCGKYAYPEDTVDYFAIHDIVHDTWYMVPRSVTEDKETLRIAMKREGVYTKYKEDWSFV